MSLMSVTMGVSERELLAAELVDAEGGLATIVGAGAEFGLEGLVILVAETAAALGMAG